MLNTPQLSETKRALLEKYIRGDLPPTVLAASAQTQQAEADVAGPRASLMPVQTGGSRRPFFFLHGEPAGGPFYCFPLARALEPDQPFYVLDPYRLEDLKTLPTLEAMAAAHIEALRAVQPEGPYLLGGFCDGGLVAYEMACQLHAQGQTVDLLVLVDPVAPATRGRLQLVRGLINFLGNLMELGQDKRLDWFLWLRHIYNYLLFSHERRLKVAERSETHEQVQLERNRYKGISALPELDALFPTTDTLRDDYPGIFDWVALSYRQSLYPGKITFFWPSEKPSRKEWRSVEEGKKEVEVHVIAGTQTTCKTDYLHDFAERLRLCLRKAQAAVEVTSSPVSLLPQTGSGRASYPAYIPGKEAPIEEHRRYSRISLVIPTRNEAQNLQHVLPRIPPIISEVILVDGHSTDDTIAVAQQLLPTIRVIEQIGKGKGDALRVGFAACTGDIIVMLDADGSTDPNELPRFVEALIRGNDFAKGSRFLQGGGSDDITHLRRLGNYGFCTLVNLLFGTRFSDLCYGYNAFWKHCLDHVEIDCDGFEIETLLNLRIHKANLKIAEVPSFEHPRIHGQSNLHLFRDGWRVLRTIMKERGKNVSPLPQPRQAATVYSITERSSTSEKIAL